ncbi:MAG: CopG family antitoxin [Candidatus Daviesbacteria bacterium]|nr:CopG family antitoxin [Candidatus Daviesbacteria bacterium]
MNTTKRKKSRIPRFKSYEEEATWWDTHDTTEFEDEFKPVKLEFAKPLEHILGVRMDGKTLTQLTELGSEMGIGPSTLVRMWIMEKLKSIPKRSKQSEISSQATLHQIKKPQKHY